MQVTRTNLSDSKVKLVIEADGALLEKAKNQTLRALSKDLRLPGFRAPLAMRDRRP